jgi:hypothetical protein
MRDGMKRAVVHQLTLVAAIFLLSPDAFAAKIYQCRSYGGGEFFSNTACSGQRAVLLGAFDVPDNMPFDQQINLVQQRLGQSASARAREDDELGRNQECASVKRQLSELTKKYERGQYVPVSEVNADQAREWQLKQRRSALRCH